MANTKLAKSQTKQTAIVPLNEELAQYAQEASANEKTSGQFVSIRSGILQVAGAPMAGNEMDCIIVDHVYENQFYTEKFDPNNQVPPKCFAFARKEDELKPHEKAVEPQNEACFGCPQNAFGSDTNSPSGKGKACKNVRRLALIPLVDGADAVKDAELYYFKLPVTSVNGWGYYVKALASTVQRPPFAMGTHIKVVPDPKTQFKVQFSPLEALSDEVVAAVLERRRQMGDDIMFPYEPKAEVEAPAPQAKGRPAPKGRKF